MNERIDELNPDSKAVALNPSLQELVQANGLDPHKLSVALRLPKDQPDLSDRTEVFISDGAKAVLWKVPSLRALFRGDTPAPADLRGEPPPAYLPLFLFIEKHVLTFGDAFRDKTDGEFEEAFSNLKRRPDGRSLSGLHFFLWQVAAGLLGTHALSAAEFDAIFGRLAQSARTFKRGGSSRNYTEILRGTVGQM